MLKVSIFDEGEKHIYGLETVQYRTLDKIELSCGKNDWASFGLLIEDTEDMVVCTDGCNAFSPTGKTPVYRVEFEIDNIKTKINLVGTVTDDDGIPKADILLNDSYAFVERGKGQQLWLECSTDKFTADGDFFGFAKIYRHEMFGKEQLCFEKPVKLHIYNYLMKEPSDYRLHLDLWQHNSNIARKHEVKLWSEEHFEIIEEYVKTLAELGQKSVTAIVSEIPWSGQRAYNYPLCKSDFYEYSMVSVKKDKNRYSYDFGTLKKYIELCFKYGINKEIEVFGLSGIWQDKENGFVNDINGFPEDIRIRYYDTQSGEYAYFTEARQIEDYLLHLRMFFIENGYMDIVRVIADEPDDEERYAKTIAELKRIVPEFKFKAAINHFEFAEKFGDDITDIVPAFYYACENHAMLSEWRERRGGRLSSYVCCQPLIPNTFVCSSAVESRVLGIVSRYLNFDGILRWSYTAWPQNPRERLSFKYPIWRAGDCNFVYPGNNGKPLKSLRWKYLKRAVEDYELLESYARKFGEDKMKALCRSVIKTEKIEDFNIYESRKEAEELYSVNYGEYQRMREKILYALETKKGEHNDEKNDRI